MRGLWWCLCCRSTPIQPLAPPFFDALSRKRNHLHQGILGPNGMAIDPANGDLVMNQHGERRVAR